MRTTWWLGVVAMLLLTGGAGCSDDQGEDDAGDAPVADVMDVADVAEPADVAVNDAVTGMDRVVPPDNGDAAEDAVADAAVDVAPDVAPDVAVDVAPDVGPDVSFEIVYLGTLGGAEAVALGLDEAGRVVGWSLLDDGTTRHAYVWTDGAMEDLGTLEGDEESTARAIDDAGTIVGTSESNVYQGSGDYRPFVFRDGVMTELPSLGGEGGWAAAISSTGLICGFAYDELARERAVTWTDGVVTDISADSGRERQRALGLNAAGDVVGMEYTPMFGPGEAFRYDADGWTVIGGADHPYQAAEAHDINDVGVAVGFSGFPSGAWRAALWAVGATAPSDLGTLPDLPYAELYAVNADGWAVGRAYNDDATVSRAILWNGSELLDLDALLPASFDGVLWEARDINDAGQIAATALVGARWHAVRLTLPASLR